MGATYGQLVDLNVLGGAHTRADAINADGVVAGTQWTATASKVWRRPVATGTLEEIPVAPGDTVYTGWETAAINKDGIVVGATGWHGEGFMAAPGQAAEVITDRRGYATANGINDAGQIAVNGPAYVGNAYQGYMQGGRRDPDGTVHRIAKMEGTPTAGSPSVGGGTFSGWSQVRGIAPRSTDLVGWAGMNELNRTFDGGAFTFQINWGMREAYRFTHPYTGPGDRHNLNDHAAARGWQLLYEAIAVNDTYVVGWGAINRRCHAFRYTIATNEIIDLDAMGVLSTAHPGSDLCNSADSSHFNYHYPMGINRHNEIVGNIAYGGAFYYSDATGMIDLQKLVDPVLGVTIGTANAISDSHEIVGGMQVAGDSKVHAYKLKLPSGFPGQSPPPIPAIDWVVAPHYPGFQMLPSQPPPATCALPPELQGVPGFFTLPCSVGGEPGCRIVFQNQAGTSNGECTPQANASPACTLACGKPGVEVGGTCAGVEFCNGLDDDCDGAIDEGGVCQVPHSLLSVGIKPQYENALPAIPEISPIQCALPPGAPPDSQLFHCPVDLAGTPGCMIGLERGGHWVYGACLPQACTPGSSASCRLACGEVGTFICAANGTWPACQGIERCNGKDDDCDGTIDEGGLCQIDLPPGVASAPNLVPGPPPPSPPPASACTLPPDRQAPGFSVHPCVTSDHLPGCEVIFTNQGGSLPAGGCTALPCTPGTVAACTLGCGGAGSRSCDAGGHWSPCAGSCMVPLGFDAQLDACGSQPSGSPIVKYTWDVTLPDRPPVHFERMSCRSDFVFPAEGTYPVKLTVTAQNGAEASVPRDVTITNKVIVSLGDSLASGEGNPDVPAADGSPAVWLKHRCDRSLRSGHALSARDVEESDRHSSVTFLPLGCSGATTQHLVSSGYAGQVPDGILESPQIPLAKHVLSPYPQRPIDALLLQVGANDIGFSDRVLECAIPPLQRPSDDTLAVLSVLFPPLAALFALPEGFDLTSCSTQNNIDFIKSLLDYLLLPNADLPARYDQVGNMIRANLNVAPQHVYTADYPDPTGFASGFCDEIILQGAVSDGYVAALPEPGAAYLNPIVAGLSLAGLVVSSVVPDGVITQPEAIFAHEHAVIPLNNAFRTAAAKFNWTYVGGVNDPSEFGSHGYCLATSQRWVRQYSESKRVQSDRNGTLHPNNAGHESYRRHYTPRLLSDLGL